MYANFHPNHYYTGRVSGYGCFSAGIKGIPGRKGQQWNTDRCFANSFNQVSNGRTVTAGIQGSVNWPKWPGASLGLQYMNNQSADETVLASFRELYANISINYNF